VHTPIFYLSLKFAYAFSPVLFPCSRFRQKRAKAPKLVGHVKLMGRGDVPTAVGADHVDKILSR